jgi:hypothetical protein
MENTVTSQGTRRILETKRAVLLSTLVSACLSALVTLAFSGVLRPTLAEAQAVPAVVRSRSFEVVDAAGNTRGALATQDDGTIGLFLNDGNGTTRVAASVRPDGTPSIILSDAAHWARAYLTLSADGSPTLTFAQPQNKLRMVQSDGSEAIPGLAFYDENFNVTWSAP